MKAVIFSLGSLIKPFTPTPLPGATERLAALRTQGISFAIATNQTELIQRTAENEEKAPDSVKATAKIAANFKEIIQVLGLQHVPWFVSLGDTDTQDTMSSGRYQSVIEEIKKELATHFPGGTLFVSSVIGPAPSMLLVIAHHLQVPPGDCLYVGNKETDRHAAEAAGMQFEMMV